MSKRCHVENCEYPEIACTSCRHFYEDPKPHKYQGTITDLEGQIQDYVSPLFDTYNEAVNHMATVVSNSTMYRREVTIKAVPYDAYDLSCPEFLPPVEPDADHPDIEIIETTTRNVEREEPTMNINGKVRELINNILSNEDLTEVVKAKVKDELDYEEIAERVKGYIIEATDVDSIASQLAYDFQDHVVDEICREIDNVGVDNCTEKLAEAVAFDDLWDDLSDDILDSLPEYL